MELFLSILLQRTEGTKNALDLSEKLPWSAVTWPQKCDPSPSVRDKKLSAGWRFGGARRVSAPVLLWSDPRLV